MYSSRKHLAAPNNYISLMLIPGHIGLTLGAAVTAHWIKHKPFPSWLQIAWYSLLALIPDILDKGIHSIYPRYPTHGIFHSVFLYGIILILLIIARRQLLIPVLIPAFNAALDLVATPPGLLLYPLTGWTNRAVLMEPAGKKLLEQAPWFLSYTTLRGHLLVFELLGTAIILLVVGLRLRADRNRGSWQARSIGPKLMNVPLR